MSRRQDHSDDSAHQLRPSSSTQLDVEEVESELLERDRDTVGVTRRPGQSTAHRPGYERSHGTSAPRKSKGSPRLKPRTRDVDPRTDPNLPSTSKNFNVNAAKRKSRSRSNGRHSKRTKEKSSKKLCDNKRGNNYRRRSSLSPRRTSLRKKSETRSRSSISSSSSSQSGASVIISHSSRYRVTPCPSSSRSASRSSSKSRSLSRSSRSSTRSRVSWKDSRTSHSSSKTRSIDRNHSRSRSSQHRSTSSLCRHCGYHKIPKNYCRCAKDAPEVPSASQGALDGNSQNCATGSGGKSSAPRKSQSRGGSTKSRSSRTNNCDEKKETSYLCCLM